MTFEKRKTRHAKSRLRFVLTSPHYVPMPFATSSLNYLLVTTYNMTKLKSCDDITIAPSTYCTLNYKRWKHSRNRQNEMEFLYIISCLTFAVSGIFADNSHHMQFGLEPIFNLKLKRSVFLDNDHSFYYQYASRGSGPSSLKRL